MADGRELEMVRPIAVRPLEGYKIWIRYADGTEGAVDLSDLAGRGAFAPWKDRKFFETVRIGEGGAIAWGKDIDLCPDAVYMRLTGKKVEEVFPNLKAAGADA